MFNFTTTTLIHSVDQFIANPTNNAATDSKNTLLVNGVNLFKKENVVAIYRNPYVAPLAGRLIVCIDHVFSEAAALFPEDGVPTKMRFRLKFSLRRTGDNNSYYARDEVFKGKDFVYEWVGVDGTTAAQVAKQIKKINRLYGDIFLDVHAGTSADDQVLKDYDENNGSFGQSVNSVVSEVSEIDKLVFVNDNYGMFTDATIQVWMDGYSDCCHYQEGGWVDIDTIEYYDSICVNNCTMLACEEQTRGVKDSLQGLLHIVDCVNGVGTYDQILRDLRLPTMENLGYMSLTQQMNEMPIPGMKYVQYTLHYVTCRGILGGSAVGEVTHSKTTHVFFVPATCCDCQNTPYVDVDTAFQSALHTAFGWDTCTGDKLVPAPHDNPVDEPLYGNQLAPAAANSTRTARDISADASLVQTHANISGGGGDVPNLYCFNSQTGSINNPGGISNGNSPLPFPVISKDLGKQGNVQIEVDKNSDDDEVETKITTDGSIPKVSSTTYEEPFEVETGTAIKAINYRESTGETSMLVETVAVV